MWRGTAAKELLHLGSFDGDVPTTLTPRKRPKTGFLGFAGMRHMLVVVTKICKRGF